MEKKEFDLSKIAPAGHGKNREKKSQLRPLTDVERRAANRKRTRGRKVKSDDERYSIKGDKAAGLPGYKNRKMALKAQIDLLKQNLPAPKVADLEISNPVLAQVEDDALRARIQSFMQILLEGGKHKVALSTNDFTWNHIQNLRHKYVGLHELWIECRDIGDEYRQVLRSDAAHERAVEGVEESLYSPSGKFLGSRRVYSDRLLELLIKSDDPDKFSERRKVDVRGTVINLTTGFNRATLRDEVAQEAIDVEEEEKKEEE